MLVGVLPRFCWYYRGLCGPCFCLWCYASADVGVVADADATVVSRSLPVVVAFHMGSGVCFVSHSLRSALVAIVPGVVSVGPTIFSGFVAP